MNMRNTVGKEKDEFLQEVKMRGRYRKKEMQEDDLETRSEDEDCKQI